jgi:hypothetical protein
MKAKRLIRLTEWASLRGLAVHAASRAARLGRIPGSQKINGRWMVPAKASFQVADPAENLQAGRTSQSLYGRGRAATRRSQYLGVTFRPHRKKCWEARAGGRFLGGFETQEEAAMAYNEYVAQKAATEGWRRDPPRNEISQPSRRKK